MVFPKLIHIIELKELRIKDTIIKNIEITNLILVLFHSFLSYIL
jgi:hypothetical protein